MQDPDILCLVSLTPTGQVFTLTMTMIMNMTMPMTMTISATELESKPSHPGKMDPLAAMYGYHHQPLADHRLGELDPREQV